MMIEYPIKCRIIKNRPVPCHCEIGELDDVIDKEAYHSAGLWHNKDCPNYGKDVFDETIIMEFENNPHYQLIIKKYHWRQKDAD